MKQRVLVIGLDGATFDLIGPWAAQGHLPTFRRLLDEGCHAALRSTIPYWTVPAWAALMTGRNPAKLGVYGLARRREGSYRIAPPALQWDTWDPIWEVASRSGKQVCVINIPTTSMPSSSYRGIFIPGIGPALGMDTKEHRRASPSSIERLLAEQAYEFRVRPSEERKETHIERERYLEAVRRVTEKKLRLAEMLLPRQEWDLFMLGVFYTDTVQHMFWRDMQAGSATAGDGVLENAILDCYKLVDAHLQKLLELAPPDTTLVLLSDHGHTQLKSDIDLNTFFLQQGWLKMKTEQRSGRRVTRKQLSRLVRSWGLTGVYRRLSSLPLISNIDVVARRAVPLDPKSGDDVDWTQTLAYAASQCAVFLNVKGREPQGIVDPATEYGEVRERLACCLEGLRDPDLGCTVVRRVWRREELLDGPFAPQMPDLLLEYEEGYQNGSSECAPQKPSVFNPSPSFHSSTHTINGVFAAMGPEMGRGRNLGQVGITDVAPTLLHLLDVPIPRDFDGEVVREAFREDSRFYTCAPQYQEPVRPTGQAGLWLSEEEEQTVKQRLRDLGYL